MTISIHYSKAVYQITNVSSTVHCISTHTEQQMLTLAVIFLMTDMANRTNQHSDTWSSCIIGFAPLKNRVVIIQTCRNCKRLVVIKCPTVAYLSKSLTHKIFPAILWRGLWDEEPVSTRSQCRHQRKVSKKKIVANSKWKTLADNATTYIKASSTMTGHSAQNDQYHFHSPTCLKRHTFMLIKHSPYNRLCFYGFCMLW